MAIPTPPQQEPQPSKDAKNQVMRESLLSTLKKTYESSKNPPKNPKAKKTSFLNTDVTNPDTAFQIWKYPS